MVLWLEGKKAAAGNEIPPESGEGSRCHTGLLQGVAGKETAVGIEVPSKSGECSYCHTGLLQGVAGGLVYQNQIRSYIGIKLFLQKIKNVTLFQARKKYRVMFRQVAGPKVAQFMWQTMVS